MERGIRATKREIEAQNTLGGDTKELKSQLKNQLSEYRKFSNDVGIRAKENRLRVISGSSDLKKTKAYKNNSNKADIKFKSQKPSNEVRNDRNAVINSYNSLSEKAQRKMTDVTFELGCNGSKCDYEKGIIYVASGAGKEDIDHEFGHLIEHRMMSQKDVDKYKKYLVENISPIDVYPETYYNDVGDAIEIVIVHGSRFVSEYQGRIYVNNVAEAFNDDESIKTELMLETISEPFRMYQNQRDELSEHQEVINLIERAMK